VSGGIRISSQSTALSLDMRLLAVSCERAVIGQIPTITCGLKRPNCLKRGDGWPPSVMSHQKPYKEGYKKNLIGPLLILNLANGKY
jgi:hypothetical protein